MKSIFKPIILTGLIAILMVACKEEELRTHFPISMPVFEQAVVSEQSITYGDSISLAVKVADKLTPLSTLEIKIIVEDELIAKESV